MYPHTRKMLEMMGDRDPADEPDSLIEPAEHDGPDAKILQLKIKRRYQLGLIRKMLEDAGYQDLAKMTNVGKTSYDLDGQE